MGPDGVRREEQETGLPVGYARTECTPEGTLMDLAHGVDHQRARKRDPEHSRED